VTASAMFSTVAGMDCRVGSRAENNMAITRVCVCEREREREREREKEREDRQTESETKIAEATFCFLWSVNIILAIVVYQNRKDKLSLI
jgi:hypothetical protein